MWIFNNSLNKWYRSDDTLLKDDFDYLKQELSATRFYSKALSGSSYMIINNLNNMYDILNSWKPRNWYISTLGSKYSKSLTPKFYPESIDVSSIEDFYVKNMSEYGLSLKTLFTPDRVINDFMQNYIQVDLATDSPLNLSQPIEKIDGVKLIEGYKVLVKNQMSRSTLNINDNPTDFFEGSYNVVNTIGSSVEYEYPNELNGIYIFRSGLLLKSTEYDSYEKCIRLSANVYMGTVNAGKQFHLNRLLSGFYPKNGEPMYFTEGHNWMVRNRVDYNNLFETNYYDVLMHPEQNIIKNGIQYTIPERVIQVGEFGIFTNTQYDKTNLIDCKWKENLRSISQTEKYYWVCGDNKTLLKVDKGNFQMEFIKINTFGNFKCINFYDNLRGVLIGDFNNVHITDDGGLTWKELRFENLNSYSYTKVVFKNKDRFFVCGSGGIFVEFQKDIDGWKSHKRRISRKIKDDEYLLDDMINDMMLINKDITLFGVSIKSPILLATNDSKLIIYDENKKTGYDFVYMDFNTKWGDIKVLSNDINIEIDQATNLPTGKSSLYFSSDRGLFEFSLNSWNSIELNTSKTTEEPVLVFDKSINRIYKYLGGIYIVGNYSLNKKLDTNLNFVDIDSTFYSRLKSKLVFLNYDVASKLNFFTDEGDYRLPNSSFINSDYFSNKTEFKLTNLNDELTWYDYWLDKEKVFKYNNVKGITGEQSISNTIKPSLIFKGTDSIRNTITVVKTATASSTIVADLITQNNKNKTTDYNLYLKDNLMILYNPISNSNFDVSEGDILRLKCSLLEDNFLVNKIDGNFIYMYSNFNENIINNLSKNNISIQFINLNRFSDYNTFINNFNNHSIGNGYKASLMGNSVKIEPVFNNLTSYYNLSTNISATSSVGFIKFSSPDMLNYGIPDATDSIPQTLICDTNIYPNDIKLDFNIIHDNSSDLIINLIGPSGKIINVVNKNLTNNTTYNFNSFKKDVNIPTTGSYKSNTTNLSDLLINGSAKGDWKLFIIDSVAGNKGYLKNWSISFTGYISEEMKYESGFLKFGYTPRYNLLDYLTSINDDPQKPYFYPDKEYLSLPVYSLPLGPLVPDGVWMNSSGKDGVKSNVKNDNKIYFGENLKFEWTSILLNTFVDIEVTQGGISHKSNRLLVTNKYYDYYTNSYVIEFHKMINFNIGTTLTGGILNIRSRRKLSEISYDLAELNNIHKNKQIKSFKNTSTSTNTFEDYDNYLNFKIPTDNYVKVLLSDLDTYKNITGIVYTDDKNQLAINFTNIGKEVVIPIVNTANIGGDLYIKCLEKHGLINGQGVVLEFNGGDYSSQYLNQQYFGYQTVKQVYDEYEFTVNVQYGQDVYIGNDSGFIKYYKKDPFFNFEPVDIMDVSLSKEVKQAILLNPENTKISGNNWSLVNVDFTKYRYRLMDGLTLSELNSNYQWILEAEITDAVIGKNGDSPDVKTGLIWYSGNWEFGRWFGGTWYSGVWMYGDWYGGTWNSKSIQDKKTSVIVNDKDDNSSNSVWMNGRWFGGTWNNGVWLNGRFYDGTWNNGWWYNGIWNRGKWNNGSFIGGVWIDGTWENGIFSCKNEPAFWVNGTWNGGDFENGIWYNGSFNQKGDKLSRFGWGAYASRPAYWNSGSFSGGNFYSGVDMEYGVSKKHTYGIWKTGKFTNGNFYGGVVYNIDMTGSNWMGGILEDIQIIGFNEINNSFILNGIFRFNIGDTINVTGKTKDFEEFGSLDNPILYTIVKIVLDETNKLTEIFVDLDIVLTKYKGYYESETKRGKSMLSSLPYTNLTTNSTVEIKKILSLGGVTGNILINDDYTSFFKTGKYFKFTYSGQNSNGYWIGPVNTSSYNSSNNITTIEPNYIDIFAPVLGQYSSIPSNKNNQTVSTDFLDTSGYTVDMDGKNSIQTNNTYKKIINYVYNETSKKILDVRVRVKLENITSSENLSKLEISLKMPNEKVVSILPLNNNGSNNLITNSNVLKDSVFSISSVYNLNKSKVDSGYPFYDGVYKSDGSTNLSLENGINKGYWEISISCDKLIKINDVYLEFCYDDQIGAQIGYPSENGFDTGLRIVSHFKNSNWKSGIWENGIFDDGLWESGIWYDGIFNGEWV